MALTAKPISTISYNTEQFIVRKLETMFKANIVTDYRYIKHIGEDGDKDHIHMLIYPNKRIDTAILRNEFIEVPKEQTDNDKPLGCLPFRTSAPDHWLMYVLHDKDYLKAHNSDNDGDGKIEYQIDDIVTPFKEQLIRDYRKALPLRRTENQQIIEALTQGHSIVRILMENNISPQRVATIKNMMLQEMSSDERLRIEIQRKTINALAQMQGKVTVVEDMPQTKADKMLGIQKEYVEEYQMNYTTGETELIKHEIRDKNDDDVPW